MSNVAETGAFEGRYFRGKGDVEYLQLLDIARRMLDPDPEFQSVPMFYQPGWNGLVEGPTWGAWWIQNSYGPTYCALPMLREPFLTFLQNSQDLWFDQMGDGKRVGGGDWKWVAPDGCLCDAAAPNWIYYKQGDGRVEIHDWGMEFTAAGLLLQSELLLISRDEKAIAHYLPLLERCANFIETRRDRANNLFLAGPAGNLLAPSYAGWKRPDGTYDKAYLTGLSITYIAALDRLIELEKLERRTDMVTHYSECRTLARKGLPQLMTGEGYFIKSLDPDGTRHGVYGAEKHGYFEAVCNHDAICFRVADDKQAERIYAEIASIPDLRPHDLIITNCPSLDDMYTEPTGLWQFGTWVNGGHWTTCEARMIMAYYRLGKYNDARRSMQRILDLARRYRLDNPLVKFGSEVYQPNEPINTVYDSFGAPAAMVRGLFEYLYRADGLTLMPHIPAGITEFEQRFPVRFGTKQLYLAAAGKGPVTAVRVNGKPWKSFDAKSVFLSYDRMPDTARMAILMGNAKAPRNWPVAATAPAPSSPPKTETAAGMEDLEARASRLQAFHEQLTKEGFAKSYAAEHARFALEWIATTCERRRLQAEGKLQPLPEPSSQAAADRVFIDTANKLCEGLGKIVMTYAKSEDPARKRIYRLWLENSQMPGWYNIRSLGQAQAFRLQQKAARMSISGKAESSCGWAYDFPEPLTLPTGAKLILDLRGSPGARYFVDLMTPDERIVFQTRWRDTPQERNEVSHDLPVGAHVGRIILYTMNMSAEAYNDFHRVALQVPGQNPLASFFGATASRKPEAP